MELLRCTHFQITKTTISKCSCERTPSPTDASPMRLSPSSLLMPLPGNGTPGGGRSHGWYVLLARQRPIRDGRSHVFRLFLERGTLLRRGRDAEDVRVVADPADRYELSIYDNLSSIFHLTNPCLLAPSLSVSQPMQSNLALELNSSPRCGCREGAGSGHGYRDARRPAPRHGVIT